MRSVLLIIAIAFLGTIRTNAQTTYTQAEPKTCNASGYHPITSFAQFDCRGVTYNGGIEWFVPEFEIFTAGWSISSLHSELTVDYFTTPSGASAGTFGFHWSGTDTTGTAHNGSVTGTWVETKRGAWYYPIIKESTLVINE